MRILRPRALFAPPALLLISLAASVAPAAAESWSSADVEAAERYREEERERAARYRAALESAPNRAAPSAGPRKEEPSAAEAPLGDRLTARVAAWLRAWIGAWLADVVEAANRWLVGQLGELGKRLEDRPARQELRRAGETWRGPLRDWIGREQERARRLVEGPALGSDPSAEEEWAEREAARAREWARRAARRAPERSPAPWEERWREAESWEAIERERALRQLESAREWQAEERRRLESP